MSEITPERIYQLLPTIYRQRDATQGEPLWALMSIIAQEMQAIEADIDGLYEDWFIETCDKWVVPYIADLLEIQTLNDEKYLTTSQRARVANAIRYRRRKGTTAMLERMVRDATGWHGRAIEFFECLGTTQQLRHVRPDKGALIDIRNLQAIETLEGPFESVAHTIDVRSKYNMANVGLFLWRLQSYRVTRSPAYPISGQGGCYTFHPLGYDMPLFNRPQTNTGLQQHTEEIHLPVHIRRNALTDDLTHYQSRNQKTPAEYLPPNSHYYGRDRSMVIIRDGVPVSPMYVISQHLGNWSRPPAGMVAIDVTLGRLAFAEGETPSQVMVSYSYGFSADIGGGPYDRHQTLAKADSETWTSWLAKSSATSTLQSALTQWNETGIRKGLIQINDNGVYGGNVPTIQLQNGSELVIQAGGGRRPSIRPLGRLQIQAPDDGHAALTLNGLHIEGKIEITGNVSLTLQHCTLMPRPQTSSVTLEAPTAATSLAVTIRDSIIGPIRLPADCLDLTIVDSIVDGTLNGTAVAGDDQGAYGPRTTLERTTVLGQTVVKEIPLASNVIFTALVQVQRQQRGNIRYSFVPHGSRTPQRYRCQPDLALENLAYHQSDQTEQARADILKLLVPRFTSTQYGNPGYGQLHVNCPKAIRTGAEDDCEMGVFHQLKQTYREANLAPILAEYLPLGLQAEVFYVT